MDEIDISSYPEDLQLEILTSHPEASFLCTEAVQMAAFKQNPESLDRLSEVSTTVGLMAIQHDPKLIARFDWDVPLQWQQEAIKHDIWNIWHISRPSPVVTTMLLETLAGVALSGNEKANDEIKLKAVQADWRAIRYIRAPTAPMRRAAVEQDVHAIEWMADRCITGAIQVSAARSPWAVVHMLNEREIRFSKKVTKIAKKTLFDAITVSSIDKDVRAYRMAYMRLADDAEVFSILGDQHFGQVFEVSDFSIFRPADAVMKLLMQRRGFRRYFSDAKPGWKMSEDLQAWVAAQRCGDAYAYLYLTDPCSRAKTAFLESVAGVDQMGSDSPSESVCFKAIKHTPLDMIHTVYASIPVNTSDRVKAAYLNRLAKVSRRLGTLPP